MDFERIFILTGQDYPLWSNYEIRRELRDNPEREYITGLNISDIQDPPKIRKKLVLYHFFRDLPYIPYGIKKVFSGGSRMLMQILPLRKKPYVEIDGRRWDVWQASSYMCITLPLARYLLQQLTDNHKLMRYFRYSFVPEEMVIPTIVFNSPFGRKATVYEKGTYDGLKSLSAITYFNYGKEIQTFHIEDYEELKGSGKMFARKFATGVSDALMDKLDAEHARIAHTE